MTDAASNPALNPALAAELERLLAAYPWMASPTAKATQGLPREARAGFLMSTVNVLAEQYPLLLQLGFLECYRAISLALDSVYGPVTNDEAVELGSVIVDTFPGTFVSILDLEAPSRPLHLPKGKHG